MVLTEGQKQAIKKLDAEMEQAKDPCSKYIAEQLLQLATSCPEVAEKILAEKKSLAVRMLTLAGLITGVYSVICSLHICSSSSSARFTLIRQPPIFTAGSLPFRHIS